MAQAKTKPKFLRSFTHLVLAGSMFIMVALVFTNVVLRYGFNSGIAESEDIARFIFIWMVFIGSILAMQEGNHLGTDILLKSLGSRARKSCVIVSHVLMRSEEHTSELQSLMRISYAVLCLKKK